LRRLLLIIGLALPSPAAADCFGQAAERYRVNIDLLTAIADQESGRRQNAIGHNANGSIDVCKMQINSGNFTALERRFGITEAHLRADECLCVHVGGWFLADEIRRHGYTWTAVARYHIGSASSNMDEGMAYARLVFARYQALAARRRKQPEIKP